MQERTLYNLPQFIELPKSHYYMARIKLEDPNENTLNFSLSQAKRLVQTLNDQLFGPGIVFVPTSSQWIDIHRELMTFTEGLSLMADNRESLDRGVEELVDSLLAYPNPETGQYSRRIEPPLPPSTNPCLIENAVINFDIAKVGYMINEGQRMQLTNFPQTSGSLKQHIPELGLFAGTFLWVNPDYRHEEGLRAIACGGDHTNPDKQGTRQEIVSACFLPSLLTSRTGLRICSITPVTRIDPEKYTAILKGILS